MKLTLENGKTVNAPDEEIIKLKDTLKISTAEAIELWLDDHDYETNEEQVALDEKAKNAGCMVDAREVTKEKKERKPVTKKVSDEKKQLFLDILESLQAIYGENVSILNNNKLIQVKIGEKSYKIDVIEQRPKKK
jgi:hypothetical protein